MTEIHAAPQSMVFLADIGQDADAWRPVMAGLPTTWAATAVGVGDLVDLNEPFTIAAAIGGLDAAVGATGDVSVVLCGLSLGGVLATAYTIAHPERVSGLVLVASQVKPNPALMIAESLAVRLLPSSWLGLPDGLTKDQARGVLDVAGTLDFSSWLRGITQPTLVICGERDRANLPASRHLAAALPNARLEIVADAGHELNVTHPVEVLRLVDAFLADLGEL